MSRVVALLSLVENSRRYTNRILERVPQADWFRMPSEGITHLAWQVGHLAFAEYRLALERIRGRRPEDETILPDSYSPLFGRGSTPAAERSVYPPIEEIRSVFDSVHRRVLEEAPRFDDALLASPPETPHSAFTTREGALVWCAQHEMLHAGQMGLLLRLLGQQWVF